jgi:hypothetical protein
MGYTWFTLDGPGWRYGGLLYDLDNPKPVYIAYQQLIRMLLNTKYVGMVNYGDGEIEAYAFRRGSQQIQGLWTKTANQKTITIPETKFIEAYTRDGYLAPRTLTGGFYYITVGFDPLYLILKS